MVEQVKKDFRTAPISSKLKSLLEIAGQVQQSGKQVSEDLIQSARREGATDVEIHDAVLIAAVFCMFNRYVDGLGVSSPQDPMSYQARAKAVAKEGYAQSNGFQRPL